MTPEIAALKEQVKALNQHIEALVEAEKEKSLDFSKLYRYRYSETNPRKLKGEVTREYYEQQKLKNKESGFCHHGIGVDKIIWLTPNNGITAVCCAFCGS